MLATTSSGTIQKKDGVYEWGSLAISTPASYDMLAQMYLTMKSDNTLGLLFYEGIPDLRWFVETYSDPKKTVYAAWIRLAQDSVRLAGFGCCGNSVGMGAEGYTKREISFAIFREFQQRNRTIAWAALMLEHCFDVLAPHSIFGTTPSENKAMLRFFSRLGFGSTYVPDFTSWEGNVCGVYISWMTRNMWQTRQQPDF